MNDRAHTTAHVIAMTAASEPAVAAANTATQLARFATMYEHMEIITWSLAGIKLNFLLSSRGVVIKQVIDYLC